jgi:predicted acyltransferase
MGVLDKQGNFAQYIDSLFLTGHMYRKTWDPEGIVRTLPAIATTLFGVLTGHLLRSRLSAESRTAWLFVSGNALMFVGSILDLWIPINKNLWTSSYALFMAGLASNVFACAYWLVDTKGRQKLMRPFAIYGMNAITVYFLSQLPLRSSTLFKGNLWIFEHFYTGWVAPKNGSFLFAMTYVLLWFGVSYAMYRMKWFVKI